MRSQQASTTAQVIAASTLCLAGDPRTTALVPPGAAQLCDIFLSTNWVDKLFARSAKWPLTRGLWRWIERLTLPGIMQHYWLRKHWIEKHCRQAIAAGTQRVLVIGAGFDTLAYRLAEEFTQHEFVEIDHPATQSVKLAALEKNAKAIPANLIFCAANLESDIGNNAANPKLAAIMASTAPTLIIIEGVLMYLQEHDVRRLLATFRALPSSSLQMIFTYMDRGQDGRLDFRPYSKLVHRWLKQRHETFKWGMAASQIEHFLAPIGYKTEAQISTRELRENFVGDGVMQCELDGENVLVCGRI